MKDIDPLMKRLEQEGWSKDLADLFAQDIHGNHYCVCTLCGWAWPGANNRCVNPECNGFCTWSRTQGSPPDSWMPDGSPRPVGMPDEVWRNAWDQSR